MIFRVLKYFLILLTLFGARIMKAQDFGVEWSNTVGDKDFWFYNDNYIIGISNAGWRVSTTNTYQQPAITLYDLEGNYISRAIVSATWSEVRVTAAYFVDEENVLISYKKVGVYSDYNPTYLLNCGIDAEIKWEHPISEEDFTDRFHNIFPSGELGVYTLLHHDQIIDSVDRGTVPAITKINLEGDILLDDLLLKNDSTLNWGDLVQAGAKVDDNNIAIFGRGYNDNIRDSLFQVPNQFWFLLLDKDFNSLDTLFFPVHDSFETSEYRMLDLLQIGPKRFIISQASYTVVDTVNGFSKYSPGLVCIYDIDLNKDTVSYHFYGGTGNDTNAGIEHLGEGSYLLYGGTASTDLDLSERQGADSNDTDAWFFILDSNLTITEQFFLPDSIMAADVTEYEYFKDVLIFNREEFIFLVSNTAESSYPTYKLVKITKNTTSIQDLPNDKRLLLYPNPSSKSIKVLATTAGPDKDYVIFDLQGRIHSKGTLAIENEVDISSLAAGIYFLHLKGMSPMKFEKE